MSKTRISYSTVARGLGFTLVELLVVIGIIALLISILLPALSRARDSAKLVACLSNLKQLGLSLNMYGNENKGWLPAGEVPYAHLTMINMLVEDKYPNATALTTVAADPTHRKIVCKGAALYPRRISNPNSFYCPDAPPSVTEAVSASTNTWSPQNGGNDTYSTYDYLGGYNRHGYNPPLRIDEKIQTDGTLKPLMSDSVYFVTGSPTQINWNHYRNRKWQGSNFLFLDGHAEWVLAGDITQTSVVSSKTYMLHTPPPTLTVH